MSRSTNQTLTLLAVVIGCAKTMQVERSFARVDIKELLAYVHDHTGDVVFDWKASGDEKKNLDWMTAKLEEWDRYMRADKDRYSASTMIKVCDRILIDLMARIKNQASLVELKPISQAITRIDLFSDPKSEKINDYRKSGVILDKLYDMIEWEYESKRSRSADRKLKKKLPAMEAVL